MSELKQQMKSKTRLMFLKFYQKKRKIQMNESQFIALPDHDSNATERVDPNDFTMHFGQAVLVRRPEGLQPRSQWEGLGQELEQFGNSFGHGFGRAIMEAIRIEEEREQDRKCSCVLI